MSPVGFEPTISAGEPQTYALDRAATGTGVKERLYKTNALIQLFFTILCSLMVGQWDLKHVGASVLSYCDFIEIVCISWFEL